MLLLFQGCLERLHLVGFISMVRIGRSPDCGAADSFICVPGMNGSLEAKVLLDTEDDHLSTFAIDVDTASYTVARRLFRTATCPNRRQCGWKSS